VITRAPAPAAARPPGPEQLPDTHDRLPGLSLFGLFSGMCFPALINGALHQVTGQDAGLASGMQTAETAAIQH
jgi:hypothetical protein